MKFDLIVNSSRTSTGVAIGVRSNVPLDCPELGILHEGCGGQWIYSRKANDRLFCANCDTTIENPTHPDPQPTVFVANDTYTKKWLSAWTGWEASDIEIKIEK